MEQDHIEEYEEIVETKIMATNTVPSVTTVSTNGLISANVITGSTVVQPRIDFDEIFDQNCMQRLAIDYKVSEQEFIKMKETNPAFADEIKEVIARNLASEVAKRTTYTKRVDKDLDTHHFIGRAWVFSDAELKDFIRNILNVH